MQPTKIGQFQAIDHNGNSVTVEHWQKWVAPGDPGTEFLRLTNGQGVNRLAQGEYQVVKTGVLLTSDDPDAP